MKKISLAFFAIFFLTSLFSPLVSLAATHTYQSSVCDSPGYVLSSSGKCCPEDHPFYTTIEGGLCCREIGVNDEGNRYCIREVGAPGPQDSRTVTVTYDGLVPCGKEVNVDGEMKVVHCRLCHFFVMFDRIVQFVLLDLVPPIAILMIVISGVMFFTAGGSPDNVSRARKILQSTIFGLIIIFSAWIAVNAILTFPGFVNADFGWNPREWFQISCH